MPTFEAASMKLTLTIDASSRGLYVVWRFESASQGRGFCIKPARCMMWSEREGRWRGFRLGPLYCRTFSKRTRT